MSDSFVTPWTKAHQAPLFTGFPRQKYWSELPFASPGDLPAPRIELRFPPLSGGFFKAEPPGKPGGVTLSNLSLLNRTQRVMVGPQLFLEDGHYQIRKAGHTKISREMLGWWSLKESNILLFVFSVAEWIKRTHQFPLNFSKFLLPVKNLCCVHLKS